MKKINNIYLIVSITSLLLFSWACKKDKYEPPMAENSHLFITTSAGDFALSAIIKDTVSLIDLSKGVESRRWSFDEGTVNIINSDNDLTNTDQVCKVAFLIPGIYEVPLHQVYKNDAWVGETELASNVFDTITRIVIFDSVHAAFEMDRLPPEEGLIPNYRENDLSITPADTTREFLFDIWAGRYMRFMNRSTGGGTANWIIRKAESGFQYTATELDTLDYKFTSLGVFHVGMYAYNQITGDNDSISYLNLVEVITSLDPVLLDSLKVVDDDASIDRIKMVFSRDMNDPGSELIDQLSLTVIDVDTVEQPINIIGTSTDPDQLNVIWLEIDDELMNTDTVKISYVIPTSSDSILITTDGMTMKPFENMMATFYMPNFFETITTSVDWNFEDPSPGFWTSALWDDGFNGCSVSMEYNFSDPSTPGDNSLKCVMDASDGGAFLHTDTDPRTAGNTGFAFNMPEGSYRLRLWVYVEDLGNPVYTVGSDPIASNVRIYFNGKFANEDEILFDEFNPDFPVGEWVMMDRFTADGSLRPYIWAGGQNWFTLRFQNSFNDEDCIFYIDRLEAVLVEFREE